MKEALKLALEALGDPVLLNGVNNAKFFISQALAQEQEPVGKWMGKEVEWLENPHKFKQGQHLYTTPTQRTWVGLDEKDFSAINQSCLTKLQAATSAESVLKEKNT